MLPALQPLTYFDRELSRKLVDFVCEVDCFSQISDLLQPFIKSLNYIIKTGAELSSQLLSLDNAVFNHIVTRARELACFKRADIQQAFNKWCEIRDGHNVRFVWLLVEDKEVILLNKSSKFYKRLSDCLTDGWYYKPSVDYLEVRAFELLTYEVKTLSEYVLPMPSHKYNRTYSVKKDPNTGEVKLINHIAFKGVRYAFEVSHSHVTVRMPWWIENSENERRYIFYIKKYDFWFYSSHKDIHRAVKSQLNLLPTTSPSYLTS